MGSSIKNNPYCSFTGCSNVKKIGCGKYCWEHREHDPGFERKQNDSARKQDAKKLRMLSDGKQGSGYSNEDNKLVDNAGAKKIKTLFGLKDWFAERRKELTGTCQCGCGEPSSKKDDKYFIHSCCHLFPKRTFISVALHPANCIERAFWGGCHTNFDEQSMNKWVNMADWETIKAKFKILAPLLTKEEKATKFFTQFELLVAEN